MDSQKENSAGIVAAARGWLAGLVAPKRPEPSYPPLPRINSRTFETNVSGLYAIGEIAGEPLIKVGINRGVEVIEQVAAGLGDGDNENADPVHYDVIIVGAGAGGLSASFEAKKRGLKYLTLEGERAANLIRTFTKGKVLFSEPHNLENKSELWFEECSKEELLVRWEKQVAEAELNLKEFTKVTDIQKRGDLFEVVSARGNFFARRVVLSIGKAGNPRKAGVPGESEYAQKVHHFLSDPDEHAGAKVFIYGGGDVAAEAAINLAPVADKVTLATIDREFVYPKKRNIDKLNDLASAGKLDIRLDTKLTEIKADTVVTASNSTGESDQVPADVVFEMIGAVLPLPFLKKVGIKLEGAWDARRWLLLAIVFAAIYSLYALKKFPETPYAFPFNYLFNAGVCTGAGGEAIPTWSAAQCYAGGYDISGFYAGLAAMFRVGFAPFAWMFTEDAYMTMIATPWFQQGYLYSLIYTLVMIIFGYQALVRWQYHPNTKTNYQKYRFASLITFQVAFFLAANVLAVQALSLDHAWRVWGLYQPWPLFFNTFHWFSESDPKLLVYGFAGTGLLLVFVFMPVMARYHGKRFCTWICGCGGLAETLGDRWRHLSPKGERSRRWEFQGALVLAAALLVTLVTVGAFDTKANNAWGATYSYVVDFWLVAVIPVALYPFFGGKVWCRYWCPLAAYNQILSRWFGKLAISSNDKCISCTQCSRFCQVGVDVMSFAKNQQSFDNANSACIHCGICVDVCPMDVLKFDSSIKLQ